MQQVKEDDYDGLVKVMEFLKVVKEKQVTTDTMFEPLGKIIEMLRGYGVVIPEESLVQLQELPEKAPTGQLPRAIDALCEYDLVDQEFPILHQES